MDTLSTQEAEVKEYIAKASVDDLKKIKEIINTNNTKDWWDTMPVKVKTDMDEAVKQADKGELIPHDTIKENYKQWLAK